MPVNMSDVAKRAGVSRSTVSLVLNGKALDKYKFSPETIERVREVAKALGYVPNRNASSLITQKSHMIGVLQGRFDAKRSYLMNGTITKVLSPDYNCVFAIHDFVGESERQQLRMFMESRLGGLVAEWSLDPESVPVYQELYQRYGVPIICLGESIPGLAVPVLTSDHLAIAYSATKALVDMGHRRIIFASSGGTLQNDLLNRQGYETAMKESGLAGGVTILTPKVGLLHSLKREDSEAQKRYAEEVYKYCQAHSDVTAVVTQGDPLAYDLLYVCARAGVHVPGDLSVIGFGDHSPSSLSLVNLSTVCSDSYECIGERAAKMLLQLIEGQDVAAKPHTFPVKVILRGTTRSVNV